MELFADQAELKSQIYGALDHHRAALGVSSPGSGKTVIMADICRDWSAQNYRVLQCAHRQELVVQMSMKLCDFGVYHDLIVSKALRNIIVQMQQEEYKHLFVRNGANVLVSSKDTILANPDELAPKLAQIALFQPDEAHHYIRENGFGRVAAMLPPSCKIVGWTGSPIRGDGKGLGRATDGIFDTMIEGLTPRELIDRGRLANYELLIPAHCVSTEGLTITPTGEYSKSQTTARVRADKTLVGDVVLEYKKNIEGGRCITFVTDIKTGEDITDRYNRAGIPAAMITAKTDITVRAEVMKRFKNRHYLQLVNVDIFGEGVDVPALDAVQLLRPTFSLSLALQQYFRCMRKVGDKIGYIIDHVGMWATHGRPDELRQWVLNPEKKTRSQKLKEDEEKIKLKRCPQCTRPYEAYFSACPYPDCGYVPVPLGRNSPKEVEGDLVALDVAALAELDRQKLAAMSPMSESKFNEIKRAAGDAAAHGHYNRRKETIERLKVLQTTIAKFAGVLKYRDNFSDSEIYRYFYLVFKIDIATAQALTARSEIDALIERIENHERTGPLGAALGG